MHTHPISLRTRLIVGSDTCKLGHFSSNDKRILREVSSSFSGSNWFNIAIISMVNFLGLVLCGISISFPVSLYFFTRLKRLCKLIEMFSSLKRCFISGIEYPHCVKTITRLLVAISKRSIYIFDTFKLTRKLSTVYLRIFSQACHVCTLLRYLRIETSVNNLPAKGNIRICSIEQGKYVRKLQLIARASGHCVTYEVGHAIMYKTHLQSNKCIAYVQYVGYGSTQLNTPVTREVHNVYTSRICPLRVRFLTAI